VDNAARAASTGVGFVVPKRWARRAVTRNLIRRQMREATRRHERRIGLGAAVLLRQRAALDRAQFKSAASAAMRDAVRAELDLLFSQLPCATS
jgi:ribonuclease P protein component